MYEVFVRGGLCGHKWPNLIEKEKMVMRIGNNRTEESLAYCRIGSEERERAEKRKSHVPPRPLSGSIILLEAHLPPRLR
jgi:hypothetical protein